MSFLTKKSVGLHLSADAVRLVVLSKKGKEIKILNTHTEKLPLGVIKNGEVIDYKALKLFFLNLKKKISFDKINFSFSQPEPDLMREAKIKVLSFTSEAEAAERAILSTWGGWTSPSASGVSMGMGNESVMLIDIGSERTLVSVVTNGEVCYSERLVVTSDFLKDLMERGWGLDIFFDQINKHYVAWHLDKAKNKNSTSDLIRKVYLYGCAENLSYLSEYLTVNMKVPVELANVWTNVITSFDEKIPDVNFKDSLAYASAIGAALKGLE